jgi:hypothetical protein
MLSLDQVISSPPDNLQMHHQGIIVQILKKDFPQTSKVFKAELVKTNQIFPKQGSFSKTPHNLSRHLIDFLRSSPLQQ